MNLHPWCFSAWQLSRSLRCWRGSLSSFDFFRDRASYSRSVPKLHQKAPLPQAGFLLSALHQRTDLFKRPFGLTTFSRCSSLDMGRVLRRHNCRKP
jgi:hypothetical protein